MVLIDIAIVSINVVVYRCIINGLSRSDAENELQNADLTEKKGVL